MTRKYNQGKQDFYSGLKPSNYDSNYLIGWLEAEFNSKNLRNKKMIRDYEINYVNGGCKLVLFENGEEVGGGVGSVDDYHFLLNQAKQFVGVF